MSCHTAVGAAIPPPRLTRSDSDRSKTITSWPARCRSAAVAHPAIDPPIMPTLIPCRLSWDYRSGSLARRCRAWPRPAIRGRPRLAVQGRPCPTGRGGPGTGSGSPVRERGGGGHRSRGRVGTGPFASVLAPGKPYQRRVEHRQRGQAEGEVHRDDLVELIADES